MSTDKSVIKIYMKNGLSLTHICKDAQEQKDMWALMQNGAGSVIITRPNKYTYVIKSSEISHVTFHGPGVSD